MNTEKQPRPEEDIKNPKLLPLLRDAYALLMRIEKVFDEKEQQISKLGDSKNLFKDALSAFCLTKVMSNSDPANYKKIMCPLGSLCPNLTQARWPNSGTNNNKPLGAKCPYAHHSSELHFVYYLKLRIIGRKIKPESRELTNK